MCSDIRYVCICYVCINICTVLIPVPINSIKFVIFAPDGRAWIIKVENIAFLC